MRSQHEFLADTQHVSSYLSMMDDMSREVGRMSGAFEHAEGWRLHRHLGLCGPDDDPLREVLGARYRRRN